MNDALDCPRPDMLTDAVEMAHGAGGLLSRRLLEQVILPAFDNPALQERHDGGRLPGPLGHPVLTTDSYVVYPLFFPGGDIGSLAIWGTVNDLAMCGARPVGLSVGLILEEGLPMADLRRVVDSMRDAARVVGVPLVTGDTKVVDRGKGDGIYVNTTGVGDVRAAEPIRPAAVGAGDVVIVSGDVGRHGIAVLSAREGLELEGTLPSDLAPLWSPVSALLDAGVRVRCLRDLTRGGLASVLNEIAGASGSTIRIRERDVPVREPVRGACELLGLDPFYVASEGRFVAFVDAADVTPALDALRAVEVSAGAVAVGTVRDDPAGDVVLETRAGSLRPLDMLTGGQLPRIC